jgi:hypothetical protein
MTEHTGSNMNLKLIFVVTIFTLAACSQQSNTQETSSTAGNTTAEQPTADDANKSADDAIKAADDAVNEALKALGEDSTATDAIKPTSQWSYEQESDPMSNGTIYRAMISSTNTVEFDFPYEGAQRGTLYLRDKPSHGKDVIFRIEKGQILCPSYENCTVLVRFDDGKAVNYSAVGPNDNSSETIFISNYNKFVEKLLKANRVRISVNIYQQGSPVFEFDVSGFDQNKFKPKM